MLKTPDPNKELPTVIKRYGSIRRGNLELVCRLIKYKNSPIMLDVREFIRYETYIGYSKKGIALTIDEIIQLKAIISEAESDLNGPSCITVVGESNGTKG